MRWPPHTGLGYSRNAILFVGVLSALVGITFVALSATRCDRVGRRRLMLVGWAACLSWSFVAIPFIPELFATRYRYTATALTANIAGISGGAVPPLLAGTLQATYGGWAIGLMLATFALVSLACTYLLPETKGTVLRSIRGAGIGSVVS